MQVSTAGNLGAYIVPSGDSHQSEYIAECDMRRKFISKFSGSSGTAVITADKAALWTDGRYHLQASKELDPNNWILMKDGLPDTPTMSEWLKQSLSSGSKVGVDPFLLDHESWKRLSMELRTNDISLVGVRDNLIDRVWTDPSIVDHGETLRPPYPNKEIFSLNVEITGKDWTTKVSELRAKMSKKQAGSIIITALDDIAWLLNLRGSDIDFNPVFFAYCIVTQKQVILFVNRQQLTLEVEKAINACHDVTGGSHSPQVNILPYESICDYINKHLLPSQDGLIWISNRSSEALVSLIDRQKRLILASPVTEQKAIKNDVEIQNMKNCHIRDAAALCEYLCWLEDTVESNPNGCDSLWEISGADKLELCRKGQDRFMGLSFPSISASGPNGAVIHYHPAQETARPISKKELYLIDSGAQYLDGTTDVTRTIHLGEPTPMERECFTLVLKGHIQLARTVFPRFIKGNSLDTMARQFLWSQGLNYLHGTGHGVGMFLNVHEGPSSISPRGSPDDPGLEAGQILSNEPGYYEDGAFGIRIESLVVTRKAETRFNFNNSGFLEFETITLVPIQLKMIDSSLLTQEEVNWLNEYHSTCRKVVGSYLESIGKGHVKSWLERETVPLCK